MKEEDKNMELLGRYLSGNCSDKEKIIMETWLNQSKENQATYKAYKQVWEATSNGLQEESLNIDQGWEELNRKIAVFESADVFESSRRFISKKTMFVLARIAAIFLVAFGVYYVFNSVMQKQEPTTIVQMATEDMQQSLVLPDGSEITLNTGSEISYPDSFGADSRQIEFEGEAFFNIAHNPEKRFIIRSGELQIEVLGTSFNLSTCPEGEEMILYLESGKVLFSSMDLQDGSIREQLILTPGQKGVYNRNSGLICKSDFLGQNYLAWKTGIIEFEKTPLPEVFSMLEKTYNIQVETENSLENLCLTARFENETPESIFETIHTIFGINYRINGQTIQLN